MLLSSCSCVPGNDLEMLCQAQDINCRQFLNVWRDCFLSGNLHLCVSEGAGRRFSYFSLFVLLLGVYVPPWPGSTLAQRLGREAGGCGNGGDMLGKGWKILTRALVDRPAGGRWTKPFPWFVSGNIGSGTHPSMLPSSSGFQGLDFIACLSFQPTHQTARRPQHHLSSLDFLDPWGRRLGP